MGYYYICEGEKEGKYNASSKARNDAEKILEKNGYEKYFFHKNLRNIVEFIVFKLNLCNKVTKIFGKIIRGGRGKKAAGVKEYAESVRMVADQTG